MIPQYRRTLDRCDELVKRISPDLDGLMVSAVCQHICVLMAGALETGIQEILGSFCVKKSARHVGSYAAKRISTFSNANPDKILQLVGDFDAAWRDELENFWVGAVKDHIGSIVGNRHLIAHGRPTEVSISRIQEWRKSMDGFLKKLTQMTA